MKIFGYTRLRDFVSKDFSDEFVRVVEQSGVDFCINENYAGLVYKTTGIRIPGYEKITQKEIDRGGIMMVMGGDGTFLEAVHTLKGLPMPVVGVNTGRLGFLTSISPSDFAEALREIKQGKYTIQRRTMLAVEGDFPRTPEFPSALNEFSIHRHTADMIEISTFVDGQRLAVIRGDGMIISTPTGSTAYSLSAGGPIISPDCAAFVCTAIAPHNFSIRPLVVPDSSTLAVQVHSRGREVLASIDNHAFVVKDGARFEVKKSQHSAFLVNLQNISFYDTLKDRVSWGFDKRDGKH